MSDTRYDGQPLLRLLEAYVLWATGELTVEQVGVLEKMSAKLVEMWGGNGTWHDALATTMAFPPNMPDSIRTMRQKFRSTEPQQFAMMFVDANFNPQTKR